MEKREREKELHALKKNMMFIDHLLKVFFFKLKFVCQKEMKQTHTKKKGQILKMSFPTRHFFFF